MAISAVAGRLKLLERGHVLSALRSALGEAAAGRGRFVLVAGEAGVGKTAVVREFCDEPGKPARVLWGACDALFTPRPLGPFLTAAAESDGDLSVAIQGGGGPHEVAAALLRPGGGRTPSIVVVEDLHWADEATLDVVRLIARSVGRSFLVVIATYRDDELERTHPLRVVLGEIAARSAVEHLSVAPFSPEAVAELAGPAQVDAGELYRQTSGNPFFVTEALAAGGDEIPGTVRAAVLGRAARLSPTARDLLEAVAISPQRVELWLLERVAGECVEALEECLVSGMLVSLPDAVGFRHELARLAIDEALEPRRRLALHRLAFDALATPPAGELDVVRLAHHAEAAGDVTAVLRYAPEAGARAAAVGAHREAAAQYGRALRFGDSLAPKERAALLRLYADSSYLTDRCHDAIDALEELLDCHRAAGDRFNEGETLSFLAVLQLCPGDVTRAAPSARRAIALLEEFPPGVELASAYANLAGICMTAEDAAGTQEWGERAIELAQRVGDPAVLCDALASLGTMEFLVHGPSHRGKAERSLEIALAAELDLLALSAYSDLTWAAWRHREYALAEGYLQAGLARCPGPDYDLWRLLFCGYGACLRLEQGRMDEAMEWAAIAAGDPRSSPFPRVLGKVVIGLAGARRGDPEGQAVVDEALAMAAPSGELQRLGPAAAAAAEVAWLAGDRGALADATGLALALALEREASWVVGHLACWRRRAGIDADPLPPVPEPWSLELEGRAADAAKCWSDLGCDYEAALALAQAHDEGSLRRAHDLLRELEAPAAAAIVARRLRERGVRGLPRGPRASTSSNCAQLTARELDVLWLLAEGLRNVAIAERLFLSPRTVDFHVSALLRKLEAQTRGEAVANARRLGLLEDR